MTEPYRNYRESKTRLILADIKTASASKEIYEFIKSNNPPKFNRSNEHS